MVLRACVCLPVCPPSREDSGQNTGAPSAQLTYTTAAGRPHRDNVRVSVRFRYGAEEEWWAKPHTLPSVRLTQDRKETEANTATMTNRQESKRAEGSREGLKGS